MDTEEGNTEYVPVKRQGSLRSSRITNSRPAANQPASKYNNKSNFGMEDEDEGYSNPLRASREPKPTYGAASKSTRVGAPPASKPSIGAAASKKPSFGGGIGQSKKEPSEYPDEFGDEAYVKPTNLIACPS